MLNKKVCENCIKTHNANLFVNFNDYWEREKILFCPVAGKLIDSKFSQKPYRKYIKNNSDVPEECKYHLEQTLSVQNNAK